MSQETQESESQWIQHIVLTIENHASADMLDTMSDVQVPDEPPRFRAGSSDIVLRQGLREEHYNAQP